MDTKRPSIFTGIVMPNLAPGDYPLQLTVGSAVSNQPLLTVSK